MLILGVPEAVRDPNTSLLDGFLAATALATTALGVLRGEVELVVHCTSKLLKQIAAKDGISKSLIRAPGGSCV